MSSSAGFITRTFVFIGKNIIFVISCLRQPPFFGSWRHHLARWEACHWILSRLAAPYESSSLATP